MSKVLRSRLEIVELAKQWRYWVEKIAKAAREILGDCEVYVFGSVAEGCATGGSDVDVLIVANRALSGNRERWNLKARIEERASLPLYHPYEIHIIDRDEAQYRLKHLKVKIRIL